MRIGVLAFQGDVAEHLRMLEACGAEPVEVRTPTELRGVDGLVLPGGESTTIWRLLNRYGLVGPLRERVREGLPLFATCAGMIIVARSVVGGEPPGLDLIDIAVERNAYGRQRESFETELEIPEAAAGPVKVAFIRAPVIAEVGPGVSVLASHAGRPVVVQQERVLAATCHPEIPGDARLHRYFLERVVTSQTESTSEVVGGLGQIVQPLRIHPKMRLTHPDGAITRAWPPSLFAGAHSDLQAFPGPGDEANIRLRGVMRHGRDFGAYHLDLRCEYRGYEYATRVLVDDAEWLANKLAPFLQGRVEHTFKQIGDERVSF